MGVKTRVARKNRKPGLSERAIRSIPYELRLQNYEREKNDLFMQIRDLPAEEVAEAHKALVEKWKL